MTVQDLPGLNAALNSLAGCFLLAGWISIKKGRPKAHRWLMSVALGVSTAFLTSYLYYHYNAGAMTRYEGVGLLRVIYFLVLMTHIPLAALMTPFIVLTVALALLGRFQAHTRITRWLWPVWMYVSVTGVLIYFMLYRW